MWAAVRENGDFFALAARKACKLGTCCEGFDKHWIVFSFMQRFAWLPQGRPQGKQKMKARVRKNDDFFAIVVRITGKLLYIDSWHTKCAVSSEREGLRTSNLVDGQSLDLRKSPY